MSTFLSVSLTYADAPGAIRFLCEAFGFQLRLEVPGDQPDEVRHSELSLGSAVVFVSSPKPDQRREAPPSGSSVACSVCVVISDPDTHYNRAVDAGAEVVHPLKDEDYGSRGYMVRDPGGHLWYFGTYKPGRYWDGAS